MGKNSILITLFLLLLAAIVSLYNSLEKSLAENRRLSNNSNVLMSEIEQYTFRDSINVAAIGVLSLKLSDYKKYRTHDSQTIEGLGIKLKRLESVAVSATESKYQISSEISNQNFNYVTPHINLAGTIKPDSAHIDLTIYDTLTQIVHRVPRKFLFFKYGTKHLRQEIFSSNPHLKITYSEFIYLVK